MKKMVLVPEGLVDTLVRKDEATSTPELDAIVRLGKEMEQLRERRDIALEEKVIRYKEALRKYLHFQEEFQARAETPKVPLIPPKRYAEIPETEPQQSYAKIPETEPQQKNHDKIIATIPASYRKDASKLLNILDNVISYDRETKEITYKGTTVPGSNIADLVQDTISKTKKAPPVGIEVFQKAINEANVPLSLKKNPHRYPKTQKLDVPTEDEEDPQWLPLT